MININVEHKFIKIDNEDVLKVIDSSKDDISIFKTVTLSNLTVKTGTLNLFLNITSLRLLNVRILGDRHFSLSNQLTYLELEGLELKEFFVSNDLKNLSRLILRKIDRILLDLSSFHKLKELKCYNVTNLELVTFSPNLKFLELSRCSFIKIQPIIYKNLCLEQLTLANQEILEFINYVYNITSLKELHIHNCNLSELSTKELNLKKLEVLILSKMTFKKFNLDLKEFPMLHFFSIDKSIIPFLPKTLLTHSNNLILSLREAQINNYSKEEIELLKMKYHGE